MPRFTVTAAAALAACALTAPIAAQAATPAHGKSDDVSRAVSLFKHDAKPLATIDGVDVGGSAYGSSFVADPKNENVFYGLTDRGPNVDAPDGGKIEPIPSFQPSIGQFKLVGGKAVLVRSIGLKAKDGSPLNGQVSTEAGTGETIEDLDGHVLPASPNGYDPEGLVVLCDGTFWVSDEYGPYVTHFDRNGREIERLSPFNGALPAELKNREPNKGMEGLTVTPDGRTLVGVMQAALNAPDGPKSKKFSVLRIVTVDLRTHAVKQFVYTLHNTDGADTTVSEIAALSDHEFLVDEREGHLQPGSNKKLFKIDLRGATDVSKDSTVAGSTYNAAKGGLLIGGKSLEAIGGKGNTADTTAALKAAGVTPVSSQLYLDVTKVVTAVDPTGGLFGHDKVEGVAVTHDGRYVYLSNDSDFGIGGLANDSAPYKLAPKKLTNGSIDSGEILRIDMKKLPEEFTK